MLPFWKQNEQKKSCIWDVAILYVTLLSSFTPLKISNYRSHKFSMSPWQFGETVILRWKAPHH